MQKIKIKSQKKEMTILNPKKDKCPICKTPLKDVHYSWMMFHGSGKSSCCGAVYQLKSFHVDEKEPKDYRDYAKSLDDPERIEFSLREEDIKPLQQAMKDIGIQDIQNDKVYARYKELVSDDPARDN